MQCSIIPASHLDSRLLTLGNDLVLSCNRKWMYFALLYQNMNVVSVLRWTKKSSLIGYSTILCFLDTGLCLL